MGYTPLFPYFYVNLLNIIIFTSNFYMADTPVLLQITLKLVSLLPDSCSRRMNSYDILSLSQTTIPSFRKNHQLNLYLYLQFLRFHYLLQYCLLDSLLMFLSLLSYHFLLILQFCFPVFNCVLLIFIICNLTL